METSLKANKNGKPTHTAHGKAQQQALVHAAYTLIAEKGFEGLRTRDVAERAGVNIATLHYYFTTKEDLIRGVVAHLREQLRTVQAPLFQTAVKGPLEELRQEFADVGYQLQAIPEVYVVLFELVLRSLRDPSIGVILRDMECTWQAHIEGYLTQGVREHIFRPDLDIPAAAAGLMAFVKGAVIQHIFAPERFPAERVYAEIERWLTNTVRADASSR